jgi:hypothetical protein
MPVIPAAQEAEIRRTMKPIMNNKTKLWFFEKINKTVGKNHKKKKNN